MNRLPELRAALVAAAARQAQSDAELGSRSRRARSRSARMHSVHMRGARRLPLLLAATLAALGLAAVAYAATVLIPTGVPVAQPRSETFTPTSGLGVPVAATVTPLGLSVPDPAGGPPWGARYVQTTRGLGCLSVGRLVNGRLGVLGQDGVFANDRRFHELPSNVINPLSCAILDAQGHAFLASTIRGTPASAGNNLTPGGCTALAPRTPAAAQGPICPLADERLLSYGLLGPLARSVSYTAAGHTHTISVQPPLGAYLIVLPLTKREALAQELGGANVSTTVGPALGPITEVRYRDGRDCRVLPANRPGGAHPCVRGRLSSSSAGPSAAQLTAPVRVHLSARPGMRLADGRVLPVRELQLSFVARVAVSDARSQYTLELHNPVHGGCGHAISISPIDYDVRRGQQLRVKRLLEPACRGLWTGSVRYTPAGLDFELAPPSPRPGANRSITVGRFSFRLP